MEDHVKNKIVFKSEEGECGEDWLCCCEMCENITVNTSILDTSGDVNFPYSIGDTIDADVFEEIRWWERNCITHERILSDELLLLSAMLKMHIDFVLASKRVSIHQNLTVDIN